MASFPVHTAAMLADFVIPVTISQAVEMLKLVDESDEKFGYFAVWGVDGSGKSGKWALRISYAKCRQAEDNYYLVYLDEYHPRSEGKAQRVFKD